VRAFLGFFLVSGFCGLVYQVVWLRLSMSAFGVTAPMISIVVSVFMAGLALGSLAAGRLEKRLLAGGASGALRAYALAELVIALSGQVVPLGLRHGRTAVAAGGWGSLEHYLAAGAWVTLVLLPFCIAMGATYPLAMSALRAANLPGSERSFSYLYAANVAGALLGTLCSAYVLIETLGFQSTLLVAAALNATIAAAALGVSLLPAWRVRAAPAAGGPEEAAAAVAPGLPRMLFATGLASMGMEVVWTRAFTAYLGNVVYAFATILALYLAATTLGAVLYRRRARPLPADLTLAWLWVGALALLPLLAVDPLLPPLPGLLRATLGLVPFCLALGWLTPALLDAWSKGSPSRAGTAYAVNVAGCILGPLLAGFVLLPRFGDRTSLALLAAGMLVFCLGMRPRFTPAALAPVALGIALYGLSHDFETRFEKREVRRDYTATVIATGTGMQRTLMVNGVGMTYLTPVTKMMAHLPMAARTSPPRNAVVICLGMGTTFRSLLSWGVPVTAVELVPGVPQLLPYFHADAAELLARPGARIAVDDGRRFLERSSGGLDVITLDPPPPMEAAGSSLLYSVEFYDVARRRLAPGGVLHQWIPVAEPLVLAAATRALADSFPHVRVFQSIEGWGFHFLASAEPLELSADALAERLPEAASRDLVEWNPGATPQSMIADLLSREIPLRELTPPFVRPLRDDRPVNEYYFLRRLRAGTP
jgi:spermidine synthase